jgi:hypothetical protein
VGHVLALLYVLKVQEALSNDLPDISMGKVL